MKINHVIFLSFIWVFLNSMNFENTIEKKILDQGFIKLNNDDSLKQIIENKFQFDSDTLVIDTLILNGYKLLINPISKNEFTEILKSEKNKIYGSCGLTKIEENFNEKSERLNDSTIIIKLKNGLNDTIENIYSSRPGGVQYYYIDFIDKLNLHILVAKYWESCRYILVNDSTGHMDKKSLLLHFSIDNDMKRLITYNWDEFAYNSDGFKFYEISGGKLIELFNYTQKNPRSDGYIWSLSDVYIINENELLYVHQIYVMKTRRIKKCYSRMIIESPATNKKI